MDDGDGLTYAEAGVDIEGEAAAIQALIDETGDFAGDFAGFIDIGDRYLALATDCVGTKVLVAAALEEYSTIGIDAIAMNVNDLVAGGFTPTAFVDYLAVSEPDPAVFAQIGNGLSVGAEEGNIALLGGETSVVPEIVDGMDLAGTAVGLAGKDELVSGPAAPGDRLIGIPSNGIHANGLTLARTAVTERFSYDDPLPGDESTTIGQALLEPTRLYTDLHEPIQDHEVSAAAHVTGGGWLNLLRLGSNRYVIDDPLPIPRIFAFIQEEGAIADREMYRTFNMGMGFVVALPPSAVDSFVQSVAEATVVGEVQDGPEEVRVDTLTLTP